MTTVQAFGPFRFPAEMDIVGGAGTHLQFPPSRRGLRMLAEYGVQAGHVGLHRWTQRLVPELNRRARRHLRP